MSKTKTYRFFYHYNKKEGKLTIHYRKKCIIADDIICKVPTNSKWNKTQPYLVMQGLASSVEIIDNKAFII